jgi:membrane-associated phospholipid phosphatase
LKTKLLALLLSLSFTHTHASNEDVGDILQLLIPAAAYSTTLYLDDDEGEIQFYKAYGSTILSTYALKYTVREKRPDSDARNSFPSGHTSSAFSGASFIHARYGFKYAVVPYIAAAFTGYSRVEANRHYTHDVIAGAALASLCSWYFVTNYSNLEVAPIVSEDFKGLKLSYKF